MGFYVSLSFVRMGIAARMPTSGRRLRAESKLRGPYQALTPEDVDQSRAEALKPWTLWQGEVESKPGNAPVSLFSPVCINTFQSSKSKTESPGPRSMPFRTLLPSFLYPVPQYLSGRLFSASTTSSTILFHLASSSFDGFANGLLAYPPYPYHDMSPLFVPATPPAITPLSPLLTKACKFFASSTFPSFYQS